MNCVVFSVVSHLVCLDLLQYVFPYVFLPSPFVFVENPFYVLYCDSICCIYFYILSITVNVFVFVWLSMIYLPLECQK